MSSKIAKIIFILIFALFANDAIADSYVQNPNDNIDYYNLGMKSIKSGDYTKAIDSLKIALKKDPQNSSIWNNLAVAYTSRGTYFYDKNIDLDSAANDYRSALYYLEFYNKSGNTDTIKQNINIAKQNLNSVLEAQRFKFDSANRFKKAKELRGKGEFAAAIIEYYEASKDRKYAYDSYIALGDLMKMLSNEYNAALYYDKALAINANNPYVHLKFGRCLYNLGNIDAAVRELDIASDNTKTKSDSLALLEEIWKEKLKENPRDSIAQMNLGTVYQNKGNYDLAMKQYQMAQTLDPKNSTIKLNTATLLQQKGSYEEALEMYNNILKTKPNDITINTYKANTLHSMGKTQEAIDVMHSLFAQNRNNIEIKSSLLDLINALPDYAAQSNLSKLVYNYPNDADIIYNYAYILHKNKKYSEALTQYKRSLAIDSKNLDAYLNIAAIYKQEKNITAATEVLNYALLVYPNNAKIKQTIAEYAEESDYLLLEKAERLYNNKDYNDAIITYKAIQNPNEEIYLGIGACYQAMERYDEAIAYYNKAISIDSSNPNAHYFLGLAYLYKKDYAKSEIELKKAMQLDNINPDIADAYKSLKFAQSEQVMNQGVQLFEANKNDAAIVNFNKAINLCPENGYAYYYRALVYDTKNENLKAINDYKKAVSLNPELTMAYYSMGLSYEALKNSVEAKKMYQKFVTVTTGNDEYVEYAKKRLSEL